MELKFKSTGSTAGFVTWLKGFKDIFPSLLIEVDLESNEFIAKCFPPEKDIVKYSKISFDDAGFEFDSVVDNDGNQFDWSNHEETSSNRIMIGIYQILGKLIEVEDMFSETDHEMIISFDICNNVTYIGSNKTEKEYQSTNIKLKSLSLTMVVVCSPITAFFAKCDDDTFLNRVCNIGSPSTYEVSIDALAALSKISSVFATSNAKNKIKFYSKDNDGMRALYAFDSTKIEKKERGSYDYLLGYYNSGENDNVMINVFKDNFLAAIKGLKDETMSITLDTAGSSRMLIDSDSSKVIIAAAKDSDI